MHGVEAASATGGESSSRADSHGLTVCWSPDAMSTGRWLVVELLRQLQFAVDEGMSSCSSFNVMLMSPLVAPGRVTTLRLTPDKPGRFEFSCDVCCGSRHEEMSGVIAVSA